MKKLFDTNSFVKNYKMYSAFSGEVLEGKPFTYCPELEEYRYNIEILFKEWKHFFINYDVDLVHRTIDWVIERIIQIGSIEINKALFNYILKNRATHTEMWDMADLLACIYAPKKYGDFKGYYLECHRLFYMLIWDVKWNDDSALNAGNEFVSELYSYLLSKKNEIINLSLEEERIISLIISYLHYHDIHDYKYVERFLNNIQYYIDKFRINYLDPDVDMAYIKDNPELFDSLSMVFNNFDSFFEDINVVIK